MGVYGSPELGNDNRISNKNIFVYCSKCGFQYSKKIRKCPNCGNRNFQPFYNKWWFWVLIVVVLFAFYPQQDIGNHEYVEVSQSVQPAISEDEYKSRCEVVVYENIERNPNDFKGELAVFKGKVVQVQEYDNNVYLIVDVTPNNYGAWKDTLYVDYVRKSNDESRILENDIIKVYGMLNGIKSYKSVIGNQVTIPYLLAEYIEII